MPCALVRVYPRLRRSHLPRIHYTGIRVSLPLPGSNEASSGSWDVILSFYTPSSPSPFINKNPPIIEAMPCKEIVVGKAKSSRATAAVGISYVATLHAQLSHILTQKWSVIEMETQEAQIRGCSGVQLKFIENEQLKKGLDGVKKGLDGHSRRSIVNPWHIQRNVQVLCRSFLWLYQIPFRRGYEQLCAHVVV